jgi:hypothetical protein
LFKRLQLGDLAPIFFAVILVKPGMPDQQHLGQAAQRLGAQAFERRSESSTEVVPTNMRAALNMVAQDLLDDGAELGFFVRKTTSG